MGNIENGTIVSGKILAKLREQGLDKGYTQVPDNFHDRAIEILNGRDIADLDEPTKKELTRAGNEQHELELAKGRKSQLVKLQLAAGERKYK